MCARLAYFHFAVLAIGLLGTILKCSRASNEFSYGYGRFEPLCGFTIALLVFFTTLCSSAEHLSLLFGPTNDYDSSRLQGESAKRAPQKCPITLKRDLLTCSRSLGAGKHRATRGGGEGLSMWFAMGAVALQRVCAIAVSAVQKADAAAMRGKAARASGAR